MQSDVISNLEDNITLNRKDKRINKVNLISDKKQQNIAGQTLPTSEVVTRRRRQQNNDQKSPTYTKDSTFSFLKENSEKYNKTYQPRINNDGYKIETKPNCSIIPENAEYLQENDVQDGPFSIEKQRDIYIMPRTAKYVSSSVSDIDEPSEVSEVYKPKPSSISTHSSQSSIKKKEKSQNNEYSDSSLNDVISALQETSYSKTNTKDSIKNSKSYHSETYQEEEEYSSIQESNYSHSEYSIVAPKTRSKPKQYIFQQENQEIFSTPNPKQESKGPKKKELFILDSDTYISGKNMTSQADGLSYLTDDIDTSFVTDEEVLNLLQESSILPRDNEVEQNARDLSDSYSSNNTEATSSYSNYEEEEENDEYEYEYVEDESENQQTTAQNSTKLLPKAKSHQILERNREIVEEQNDNDYNSDEETVTNQNPDLPTANEEKEVNQVQNNNEKLSSQTPLQSVTESFSEEEEEEEEIKEQANIQNTTNDNETHLSTPIEEEEEEEEQEESKDNFVVKPIKENEELNNYDSLEDSTINQDRRPRAVNRPPPELQADGDELEFSFSESTTSQLSAMQRINRSYEAFTSPKSRKKTPEFWTSQEDFFQHDKSKEQEEEEEEEYLSPTKRRISYQESSTNETVIPENELGKDPEIVRRAPIKSNRRPPSRIKNHKDKTETNNSEAHNRKNDLVEATREPPIQISKYFMPSSFTATPKNINYEKKIELPPKAELIIQDKTHENGSKPVQTPGTLPIKVTILQSAAYIPLRNMTKPVKNSLYRSMFSSNALGFNTDTYQSNLLIDKAKELEGDKVTGLFDYCKSLIDKSLFPISDEVVFDTTIYKAIIIDDKKKVDFKLSAGGEIKPGNATFLLDASMPVTQTGSQITVNNVTYTLENEKSAQKLCKVINDFIENKSIQLLDCYIQYLADSNNVPISQQLCTAIASPFLGLMTSFLTVPNCTKKAAFLIFEDLSYFNVIDGVIRSLFCEEITRSTITGLFTHNEYYSASLIALFVSVTDDWIPNLCQAISGKSPDETLVILMQAIINAPTRAFYIMRTILILSMLIISNKFSPFIPLVSFLRAAGTLDGGYNSLYALEHALISNTEIETIKLIPSFTEYMINNTPTLPEVHNINQIGEELYQFAQENIEFILKKLNKRRTYHPSKHPFVFQLFQNAIFLTRDIIAP